VLRAPSLPPIFEKLLAELRRGLIKSANDVVLSASRRKQVEECVSRSNRFGHRRCGEHAKRSAAGSRSCSVRRLEQEVVACMAGDGSRVQGARGRRTTANTRRCVGVIRTAPKLELLTAFLGRRHHQGPGRRDAAGRFRGSDGPLRCPPCTSSTLTATNLNGRGSAQQGIKAEFVRRSKGGSTATAQARSAAQQRSKLPGGSRSGRPLAIERIQRCIKPYAKESGKHTKGPAGRADRGGRNSSRTAGILDHRDPAPSSRKGASGTASSRGPGH